MGKRKVCARFLPHSLNDDQKQARVQHSKDMIQAADNDPNFLKTSATGDETWCFQYEPLTKRQSSVWISSGSPKQKKVRLQKSRLKTMLITFFDSNGIIHKEFVPAGTTVTSNFYLQDLKRLCARIRRIRPQYGEDGSWSLLHDNAPSHNALVVRQFLASKRIVVLNHPSYSLDMSPCDYFLFPKLK